jgi:hypothetical protein
MNFDSIFGYFAYALFLPFLMMGMLLVHYLLVRFLWCRRRRAGKGRLGFYPSAFALGMWFQGIQAIYQPSVAYVLEEKQDEDAEQDADADPERGPCDNRATSTIYTGKRRFMWFSIKYSPRFLEQRTSG